MLITTNQTITQWGHVFGDEMIAAAVLDRVLHHSHAPHLRLRHVADPCRSVPLGLPTAHPRATFSWGSGEMVRVQNEEPLRDAIARKARECREVDAPLIIAVMLARNFGHEHQIESALFGSEATEVSFNPSRLELLGTRSFREPDGLWSAAESSA